TNTSIKLEQTNSSAPRSVGFTVWSNTSFSFNYSVPVGTWVHLAITATTNAGNNFQLYTNGVLQGVTNFHPSTLILGTERMRSAVVLPAPFRPRKPNTTPGRTARSTPSSAIASPNRLVRPRSSMAAGSSG